MLYLEVILYLECPLFSGFRASFILRFHISHFQLSEANRTALRDLQQVITSHLRATFDLLDEVGDQVMSASGAVGQAFAGSNAGFVAFTRA